MMDGIFCADCGKTKYYSGIEYYRELFKECSCRKGGFTKRKNLHRER